METWLERKREIDLALKEAEELKARAYAISLVIDDCRRLDKSEEWEAYVDENGVVRVESYCSSYSLEFPFVDKEPREFGDTSRLSLKR